MTAYHFSPSFVWGVATAAYQIEGAWNADGKGESIWDRFVHTPGKITDASTGDLACDHYHRWPADLDLMHSLNVRAYRFSVAWPRILPTGRGAVNQAGLDFYSRLVDGLLAHGIEPFATLYHWDLPQALQDAGGWKVRATAEAFVAYTDTVTRTLGDRVKHWITHNEPWCAGFLGYDNGAHAPGECNRADALRAVHHLLLSHGWAVPVVRQHSPGARVGLALLMSPAEPASPSAADYHAMRRHDGFFNRWFLDPLYGRHYPADLVADYTAQGVFPAEVVQPGDFDVIAASTDFLGVNFYTRTVTRADTPDNLPITNRVDPPSEWTDMGWEVSPPALYNLLCRLHFDYQIPQMYITENGCSFADAPDATGRIADTRRVHYLREHLRQCHRAMQAGVPLSGYFVWSFLDNFEWSFGYQQRFGLVWVDYATQQRLPKDSAYWYAQTIVKHGFEL